MSDAFPGKGQRQTAKPQWSGSGTIPQLSFTCGYCGSLVAGREGYQATVSYEKFSGARPDRYSSTGAYIHVCHVCGQPNYFSANEQQHPVGATTRNFSHVPPDLVDVYKQAKRCFRSNCFAATVMVARRLLMVLAWRLQAEDGLTFQQYVEYFVKCGAISPAMTGWVDKIRRIGNASNHEIPDTTQEDAEATLQFVELIFDNFFEAPAKADIASPFSLRP